MPDRRPKLLFEAIQAIDAVGQFLVGVSEDAYEDSLLVRSAVERQLEILGEACGRLAREDAAGVEAIPACRLAIGLRNRIIHGYDAVDNETVYRTAIDDLPALRNDLAEWLSRCT